MNRKNNNVIFISGPTSVGKTELSLALAQKLDTEIVSADSMQIYKMMNIGTAKISAEETKGITHHMLDIVDPKENYSVSEYSVEAKRILIDLIENGKTPIVVGGTGLYIHSLIYDLNFFNIPPNIKFRERMLQLATDRGNEYLHGLLFSKDPKKALSINKNNTQRIIRALEILESNDNNENSFKKFDTNFYPFLFGMTMDRNKLYENINVRVDKMIELGLIDEVTELMEYGCTSKSQSMNGIGYKEIISFLKEGSNYQDTIEKIKKNSRNYAKRQLTWLRRYDFINWIEREDFFNINEISNKIITLIQREGN